jgi:hypothetical protein
MTQEWVHMRRGLLVVLTALALTLATSTAAFADPEGVQPAGVTDPGLLALITDDDLFSTADLSLLLATPATPVAPAGTPTQHYGPYTTDSPDSGTCGNDWATDTFDRHFTVKTNSDGTFTVVEQFKNGSFVTMDGPSPGACENVPPGGMVDPDKTGSMHGYFIIPLPPTTTQIPSSDDSCVSGNPTAPCTTAGFINSHFTACYPVGCPVTTFFFHYSAGDQGLLEHEWKNASDDRGGNHGDIRSTDGQ